MIVGGVVITVNEYSFLICSITCMFRISSMDKVENEKVRSLLHVSVTVSYSLLAPPMLKATLFFFLCVFQKVG